MTKIDVSNLTAKELNELQEKIALRWSKLSELSDLQYGSPEDIPAVYDPKWLTELSPKGSLFKLRHPVFGWLAFIFPHSEIFHILELFLRQALVVEEKPKKGWRK